MSQTEVMSARGVAASRDRIRRVRPELWRRGGAAALAGLVVLAVIGLWVAPGEAAAPAWWQVGALTQGLAWCVVAEAARRLPARGGPARVATVLLFLTGTTLLVGSALLSAGASRGTFTGLVWLALAVALPPAFVDYPYGHVRARGAYAVMALLLAIGLVGLDPAGVLGSAVQGTGVLRGGLGAVQVAVLVVWLWWRGEHSERPTRVALLWPALGAGACGLLAGHLIFAADPNGLPAPLIEVFLLVFWLLIPASVAVGLEAPQRYDVRRLISSVAVYTTMVDLTVGVVAGSLALLTLTTGTPPTKGAVATVATAAAVAFGPVLVRVRRIIEEVLFGGSTDALDTMSRLGAELGADSSPQAWVEALRSALLVPRMELRTGGELLAAAGTGGGGATETTALRAGGEHVGDLVVTVPPDSARLPRGTRAVLDLVAAPLARALQAVRLAGELHASRGRVVQAREEERRRLRRDLHDGLGPVLTGVAYSADAAVNLLISDPPPGRGAPDPAARGHRPMRSPRSGGSCKGCGHRRSTRLAWPAHCDSTASVCRGPSRSRSAARCRPPTGRAGFRRRSTSWPTGWPWRRSRMRLGTLAPGPRRPSCACRSRSRPSPAARPATRPLMGSSW